MPKKGVNKYGFKLEDFDSYKDYRKACVNATVKAYQKTEKGRLQKNARNRKYNKTEKGRLNKIKNVLKYFKTEKGKRYANAFSAKRRSAKLQRTPKWADLESIKQFYANCPKGYHVDHIVPLQGDNVSGFHVLNNLQYLSASENCSKGNKYAI